MRRRARHRFRSGPEGGYELAEGTRWLGDRLVFTDILAGTLLEAVATRPGDAGVVARLDVPLGAVALRSPDGQASGLLRPGPGSR